MYHLYAHPVYTQVWSTTPEIPTSQLLGEEANFFQGGDCSLEEGGSNSTAVASEQVAKSSSSGGS